LMITAIIWLIAYIGVLEYLQDNIMVR
jgi:hypothetical protein